MDYNTTVTTPRPGAMEFQTFAGLAHSLGTVAMAALVFALCAYVPKLQHRVQLAKLPVFGGPSGGEKQRQSYLKSAKAMYSEGYRRVRHTDCETTSVPNSSSSKTVFT